MEPKLAACETQLDHIIADLVVVVEIPAWETNDIDHFWIYGINWLLHLTTLLYVQIR